MTSSLSNLIFFWPYKRFAVICYTFACHDTIFDTFFKIISNQKNMLACLYNDNDCERPKTPHSTVCSEFSSTRSFSQSPCIQSISCRAILSAVDFSTALSVCRSAIATWQRNSVWFVTLRYDYENLLTAAVSQSVSCCRVEISGEKKKVKPSDNGRVTGVGNRWTFLENGG
jgi:hypothetical protein